MRPRLWNQSIECCEDEMVDDSLLKGVKGERANWGLPQPSDIMLLRYSLELASYVQGALRQSTSRVGKEESSQDYFRYCPC